MDVKEIFKLQMVTQMGANASNQQKSMNLQAMFFQMLMMALMSIVDDCAKALPKYFEYAKQQLLKYFTSRVKETIESKPKTLNELSVQLHTKHFQNTITMTRVFDNQEGSKQSSPSVSEESNCMVDAVLTQISKLTNVPSLQLINKGQMMITYKDKPVQMTKDIFFQVTAINISDAGVVMSIKFMLMSNVLSAADISNYVTSLCTNYMQELKNSLGNNIYFFEQKQKDSGPPPPASTADVASVANHKRMVLSTAPKQLSFTMSPFYSNKQFTNVFGEEAKLIEKRIKFFSENKDWYDSKGIPYQIGILLSGVPGSGKTSIIKSIANFTKRHIINVNFANITTATQLKNLFYSDKLQVFTDSSMASSNSYFIPIDQRLYVLEEIDAVGDIVKQRKSHIDNDESVKPKETLNDELTLMEILTVLDGAMEIPGRIIIMTTNHPEVLDDALIRPGRIDVQAHFGYATRELIAEMFRGYLDKSFPTEYLQQLPDKLLSPAEVGQVLFRHFDAQNDVHEIINDLHNTAKNNKQKRDDKNKKIVHTTSEVAIFESSKVEHEQCDEEPQTMQNVILQPTKTEKTTQIQQPIKAVVRSADITDGSYHRSNEYADKTIKSYDQAYQDIGYIGIDTSCGFVENCEVLGEPISDGTTTYSYI